MILNALSIDVEEYYNGMEFEAALSPEAYAKLPSRVERSVDDVLEILERNQVAATFFVVGEVAAAHPTMLARIVAGGHEIACHSDRHELVFRQSPEEFREDLRRAKHRLEDLAGTAVCGYRAPNYSIHAEQEWAYDILLDEGFAYDSSIYPIRHDRYGDPTRPRFPHTIREREGRRLIEFPLGTVMAAGMNLPVGGGGIFRLLPTWLTVSGIRRVNRRERQPTMFYFHPWELDAGQPRPKMPMSHRFRHYVNLERYPAKLDQLLRSVPFATAREVLGLESPRVAEAVGH